MLSQNNSCSARPRLEWLDAMRGFTMILVVAYHVAQMCYGQNERTSASLPFLVLFRMPLFFFVSGFLAYRSRFVWTLPHTLEQTWKKVKIQVLPALVFLCVYIVLRAKNFEATFLADMHSPTKGGYWFTWVLLQMFLIYYLLELLIHQVLSERHALWVILVAFVAAVAVGAMCYMPRWFTFPKSEFMNTSSLIQTARFMQYFLLGNLAHRLWRPFEHAADSLWLYPIVLAVAFLCSADLFRWHTLRGQWTNLPRTVAVYSLVLLVVAFFRYYASWFTRQTLAGRTLQYIGTRTLDVYLLHFILMPRLPEVGAWLNRHQPNFVVDVTLSVLLALLVIAFCLLISNILRVSPVYSEYFFGRKKQV